MEAISARHKLDEWAPPSLRRRSEEAEAEILDAAERFLRTRPFRDLQVWELMDDTGTRRSSFYHYFDDRHDLVVRLAVQPWRWWW